MTIHPHFDDDDALMRHAPYAALLGLAFVLVTVLAVTWALSHAVWL